jgi:hypothetical protein
MSWPILSLTHAAASLAGAAGHTGPCWLLGNPRGLSLYLSPGTHSSQWSEGCKSVPGMLTRHEEQNLAASQVHGEGSDQHRQEPDGSHDGCVILGGLWERGTGTERAGLPLLSCPIPHLKALQGAQAWLSPAGPKPGVTVLCGSVSLGTGRAWAALQLPPSWRDRAGLPGESEVLTEVPPRLSEAEAMVPRGPHFY